MYNLWYLLLALISCCSFFFTTYTFFLSHSLSFFLMFYSQVLFFPKTQTSLCCLHFLYLFLDSAVVPKIVLVHGIQTPGFSTKQSKRMRAYIIFYVFICSLATHTLFLSLSQAHIHTYSLSLFNVHITAQVLVQTLFNRYTSFSHVQGAS